MTDKMQALCDLLVRVEAGTIFAGDFVTDEEAALVYDAFPPNADDVVGSAEWAGLAYDGSLDAAKALHEAVLPGWWAAVRFSTRPKATTGYIDCVYEGQDDTPARAWLICILKAMIATDTP